MPLLNTIDKDKRHTLSCVDGAAGPIEKASKPEEASPRLGVSWQNDGVGKGVGSELNPAMAALVIASQQGDPIAGEYSDASPRLAGVTLMSNAMEKSRLSKDACHSFLASKATQPNCCPSVINLIKHNIGSCQSCSSLLLLEGSIYFMQCDYCKTQESVTYLTAYCGPTLPQH